jgi:hypothetical protein
MLCIDCWKLKGVKPKKPKDEEDAEAKDES